MLLCPCEAAHTVMKHTSYSDVAHLIQRCSTPRVGFGHGTCLCWQSQSLMSTCSLPVLTTKRKHASHQLLTCICVLLWTHLFLYNNNSHPSSVGCSYLSKTQSMPRQSAQPAPSRHSVCYMFGHLSGVYHCAIPALCRHRWSKFGCQHTCLSWKAT